MSFVENPIRAPKRTAMQTPEHLAHLMTSHNCRRSAFKASPTVDRKYLQKLMLTSQEREDVEAIERFRKLVAEHDNLERKLGDVRKRLAEHVRRPAVGDFDILLNLCAEVASTPKKPVTAEALIGPSRTAHIVLARFAAMRLCKRLWPELSTPELGRRFGGRDHSSVVHALRYVHDKRKLARISQIENEVLNVFFDQGGVQDGA